VPYSGRNRLAAVDILEVERRAPNRPEESDQLEPLPLGWEGPLTMPGAFASWLIRSTGLG